MTICISDIINIIVLLLSLFSPIEFVSISL